MDATLDDDAFSDYNIVNSALDDKVVAVYAGQKFNDIQQELPIQTR
jgi:hypothetical protein